MYSLPPELESKLRRAIEDAMINHWTDRSNGDMYEQIYRNVVALWIRENRRLRQQVCKLWRSFSEAADRHDGDYGDIRAAAGGEYTCEHIVNEIIKPNVYFNSEEAEERTEEADRIIEDFYEEDNDIGI